MFFSRMVSNLLSSKNSSISKNGRNGSSSLAASEESGTKKNAEKPPKQATASTASNGGTEPSTSPKKEPKSQKPNKSPKENTTPKAKMPGQRKRDKRNDKTGFMSLTSKKRSIKKRGISLPIDDIDALVSINNVVNPDEPTTSLSTPAFNSVWRPGTLYSDVVSGANPSTPKRRFEHSTDGVTATTPKNATNTTNVTETVTSKPVATKTVPSKPSASKPNTATIVAASSAQDHHLTDPGHFLFPTLSESRKFAATRPNQDTLPNERFEEPEQAEEHQPPVHDEPVAKAASPADFDFAEPLDDEGIKISPAVSLEMLSLQFSEMSLDSSSVIDTASTGAARSTPESLAIVEYPMDSSQEDDINSSTTTPDCLIMCAAEEPLIPSDFMVADLSAKSEHGFLDSPNITALPSWNFTPPTSCMDFPSGMGMFSDERYLYYERLSWLGLKLAMGDKKW